MWPRVDGLRALELEHVGERLALLDDGGRRVATVEVTGVGRTRFVDVPWEFAAAEGEGDRDLDEWRAGHRRYWAAQGTPVTDETEVVLLWFTLAADPQDQTAVAHL